MTDKVKTGLTFDADVLAAIDAHAASERLSRSSWLNQFLARLLLPGEGSAPPAEEPAAPAGKRGRKSK